MNDEQRKLVEDNIGLVWKVIHRYFKKYVGDEDVYQTGCLGLIKAVAVYTTDDIAFSTYAMNSIRYTILNYFRYLEMDKRKANIGTKSIFDNVEGTNSVKIYETIISDDFSNYLVTDIVLNEAFNKLDDLNKKILELYLQGYSFREMSEQMYITHQGIASRFKKKIKPLLKEVVA